MAPPKPIINRIEVYDCAGGDCSYYIFYDPAPVGTEVTVYLDGSPVETGDAEVGRIDVTSAEGVQVSVQVAFYTGAGPTLEETLSDAVLFTPSAGQVLRVFTITLSATSPCPIKWQPYNEDVFFVVMPGETITAIHNNAVASGRIWHVSHDPYGDDTTWTFIKDLPAAVAYCSGASSSMGNWRYTGEVSWDYCDDESPYIVDINILSAPDIPTFAPWASLHLITIPKGAYAVVAGQEMGGVTDQIWTHFFTAGTYKEKVSVLLYREHFKDKTFNKTLRPGLHEYALYRLVPADKIKGKTRKDRVAKAATFTFTIFERGKYGAQVYKAGTALTLLNQYTGQIKTLTTDASGMDTVTIPYDDDFFASGKQKLVCIMDDTADRIRSFRTITVSKVTGDSIGAEEDWHDEDDDTDSITDSAANSIDAAYAKI
jgi:hypothetical protein